MEKEIGKKAYLQKAEAEIIRIAGEAGAKAALEAFNREKQRAAQERRDWRLRWTERLPCRTPCWTP